MENKGIDLNRTNKKYVVDIDCKSSTVYFLIKDNLKSSIERADIIGARFMFNDYAHKIKIGVSADSNYDILVVPGYTEQIATIDRHVLVNNITIRSELPNLNSHAPGLRNDFYYKISSKIHNQFCGVKDYVDSEIVINIDNGCFIGFTEATKFYPIILFVPEENR